MTNNTTFVINPGFSPVHRKQIAHMFWQAFRGKLGLIMNPEEKALAFVEAVANPNFAISALDQDGTLLGVAGFKTAQGGFIGGELADLAKPYGWLGALWRGLVLAFLERSLEKDILLMDGIFVDEAARGKGVGSALLLAIKDKAAELSCSQVRLDVIDINPRARALYERQGFVAQETEDIGFLRHIFGFQKATKMLYEVSQ
jgi:GNAT superfamily N-acetyltransferase